MPAVTTSSGYIPGTVDTQSRYEETDVDEASVVQHNSPLSIGKKKTTIRGEGIVSKGTWEQGKPGVIAEQVSTQSKGAPH